MLTAVLVFVLLVIALLAVPVSLAYDVSTRADYKNDIVLGWAFGLLRLHLPTHHPARKPANKKKSRRARQRSRGSPNAVTALTQTAFLRRLTRFAGDLWRAVHKDGVQLNLRLGLGDPADTGQLWAVLGPIAGMLACVEGAAIAIVPDFVDAIFELDSRGRVWLVPLHVLGLSAALLLSPPVWRALLATRRSA